MEADIIISVNDTVVMQNQTPILEDLNFKIKNGEFVYLIGKTGSGKSRYGLKIRI